MKKGNLDIVLEYYLSLLVDHFSEGKTIFREDNDDVIKALSELKSQGIYPVQTLITVFKRLDLIFENTFETKFKLFKELYLEVER